MFDTNIIDRAIDAIQSDFFCMAHDRDVTVLNLFVNRYSVVPPTIDAERWLKALPPYVLRDVEGSVRRVEGLNRRMNRQLAVQPVKPYIGRSRVSHRKARG